MATKTARVWVLRAGLVTWDALSWVVATFVLGLARFDFTFQPATDMPILLRYALGAVALQILLGFITKLYRGRHNLGSTEEVVLLALINAAVGITLAVVLTASGAMPYGSGLTVIVPIAALLIEVFGRFIYRTLAHQAITSGNSARAERVIIYGAGNAGQQLAALVAGDPDAPYRVVGFIDDDPGKRNLRVRRNRVLGDRRDLARVAGENAVRTIIVAIPTATRELMRELTSITDPRAINVLVMPNTKEMVGGRMRLDALHQLDVADILGRPQIRTDLAAISDYLQGKVVLVTGAGGSIGSEIARQVHKFGPRELVMLDHDESLLHSTQMSIFNRGLLDTRDVVLCDIRDPEALDQVFADHRPHVVFHAAALKHLPMLEQYPNEGWKTNVLGSLNVLEVAARYGVERFVNISSDKAADATSVLGKTKRIAEELTAWFAETTGKTYVSVRFGNVLGSRGSMLHIFTTQIDRGGPITITHPDATRYFMTIPEACELVLQAGAVGRPSDVLVLDMGEPVRVLDVAKGLIARSGKRIEIVFTGLRPNEKVHEVLFSGDEASMATSHTLIQRVEVPPLDPARLAAIDGSDAESMGTLTHQVHAREAARLNAKLSVLKTPGTSGSGDQTVAKPTEATG